MPILDLAGAEKIRFAEPEPKPVAVPATRTLAPSPGMIGSGGGNGAQFAAARYSRLTGDFNNGNTSADLALSGGNRTMRVRGRDLATNSGFITKFLAMGAQNVIGPAGILLQAKVRGKGGKITAESTQANLRIEQEWNKWCRRGRCTADGQFSLAAYQRMAVKNYLREGENIVKLVYGRQFNEACIALQPLDNDQLDDSYNMRGADNSEIRMGVEVDQYRKPQGYWLFSGHPGDINGGSRERQRIPAKFIIHSFQPERPAQTRGFTPLAPVMLDVKQFEGWDEATLVAARWAAAKMAVIQSQVAEGGYEGDGEEEEEETPDVSGGTPGEMFRTAPGEVLNFIDPKYPTNTYRDFSRTKIRKIATGLLVSYPSLGNDLENVNFSSIRAGLLDERDHWRILQRWVIEHLLQPIYDAWLAMARLTVLSDLSLTEDQWQMIIWRARGWEWVDPVKDAAAAILRLQNGLSTYARELAAIGLDFEETMDERALEQKFISQLKLVLGTDITGKADTASDDSMDDGPVGGDKPDANASKPSAKPRSFAHDTVVRFLQDYDRSDE